VGAALPWHSCALGKAIVGHLDEAQRAALLGGALPALTGQTITSADELATELTRATTVGHALEAGEAAIGDAGVAAPVFDRDGVVGAIGLVGPMERLLDQARRDEYAVAVRMLSRELGAARPTARRFVAEAS
jgi:DNA-binding IclR family transcriptional regulator